MPEVSSVMRSVSMPTRCISSMKLPDRAKTFAKGL